MNVLVDDISQIPEEQRKYARAVKTGLTTFWEIDSLRFATDVVTPLTHPDEPLAPGDVVLALEDARDPVRYREARARAGNDPSKIKIR